jgi:acetyltransferase
MFLGEFESRSILQKYGIPVVKGTLVHSLEDAKKASYTLKYPLFLKVSSNIVHKTDFGLVCEVRNEKELEIGYKKILKNAMAAKARVNGVMVEEKANGIEMIMGIVKDKQFGHAIMLGFGGVFVQVIEDVTFRIVPITEYDAKEMIKELKAAKMLDGFRNIKPVNKKELIRTLLKLSTLALKMREIKELDINPLFVNEKGVVAADARIII